jgi:hypothetical protein
MSKKRGRLIISRAMLDAQRDEMAQALRVGFVKGMTSVRRDVTAADILKAFKKGDFSSLREDIERKIVDVADPLISKVIRTTANKTIEAMPEIPNTALRLNDSNPRVRAYVESRTQVLTDTTHKGATEMARASGRRNTLVTTREPGVGDAISAMVTRSLDVGMTLDQRADMIRNVIGLNGPQGVALDNYKKAQTAQGATGDKLNARVDAYSAKMLDYRADMIARQEVRNAQNESQRLVWSAAADKGYIGKKSERLWVIEASACPEWCLKMADKPTGLDEPWTVISTVSGEEREVDIPSDVHPQCNCSQSINVIDD